MPYKSTIRCLLLLFVVSVLAPPVSMAAAEEAESKPRAANASTVLPQGHFFTLSLEEDGERLDFSTAVASRHFSLSPVERRINFRGRLWLQEDGRELLEFSLEYQRFVETVKGRELRTANWSGSSYVEDGRALEIVTGPSYSFSVKIEDR